MIHDTRVPGFPALAASRALSVGKRIFPWKLISWQSALTCVIISWLVTSAANWFGDLSDGQPWYPFIDNLPIFTVYLANFPFDLATIFLTVRVLQWLRASPGVFTSIGLILVNITLAGLLAVLCAASIIKASDFARTHHLPGAASGTHNAQTQFRKDIQTVLGENSANVEQVDFDDSSIKDLIVSAPSFLWRQIRYGNASQNKQAVVKRERMVNGQPGGPPEYIVLNLPISGYWRTALISLSTFLPVLMYMTILAVLLVAKLVLTAVRTITLFALESLTQHDPIREPKDFLPFTMLGLLSGAIASTVKAIIVLVTWYHGS
jgi:hypothetical protein